MRFFKINLIKLVYNKDHYHQDQPIINVVINSSFSSPFKVT